MRRRFLYILLFIALWFSCNLAGTLIAGISVFYIDPSAESVSLMNYIRGAQTGQISSPYLQVFLFIMHTFSFIVPSIGFAYFVWKDNFIKKLKLRIPPRFKNIGLALVLLIGILPLSLYLNNILQTLNWPEWVPHGDQQVGVMMKEIFRTKTAKTFILNVLLLGVAASVGEELLFRGLIQQFLHKFLKNGHIAVLITAIIFGLTHFQIEGLIVRIILGAILGYVLFFTGNLWGSIILHFIYNTIQVVLIYLIPGNVVDKMTTEEMYSMPLLPALLFLIPAIFAFYLMYKNQLYGQESA